MSATRHTRFDAPHLFFAAVCALLPLIIVGEVGFDVAGVALRLRYTDAVRTVAIAWVVLQLVPQLRPTLPHRAGAADLPLALFVAAVVASVALGGGHWGTVRNLLGAIGLGFLGRGLFAPPARRAWLIHFLGATVLLVVAHELVMVPGLLPPTEYGRYRLVTANANVLGFLFAMVTPLLIGEALARPGRRRGAILAYVAVALLGALLTYSRSAAIGLTVGVLTIALAERRRRGRALLLGAVGLAIFLAVLRPDVWTAGRAVADRDRVRIAHTSLTLAADTPVLGVGFGIKNLERRFPDRYEALYGERLFRFHSANQLVDLLVGTGLVGTALALWWWVRLTRTVARSRRGRAEPARRRATGNLATMVAITVMSMVEPPLYHGKLLPVLFLVLAYVELPPPDDDGDPAGVSRG
jgi:hypothetical protein